MPRHVRVGGDVNIVENNITNTLTCNIFTSSVSKIPDVTSLPTVDETSISCDMTGFSGGVLGYDGKIYCVPYEDRATAIGIIDPVNNTFDSSSIKLPLSVSTLDNKWVGGVLAPSGEIYCAPFQAEDILVINPYNKTIRFINTPVNSCRGGTLGPDGIIYFSRAPGNSPNDHFVKVDTRTDTVTRVSSTVYNKTYLGCCLAADSNIYAFPRGYGSSNIAVLDYATDTISFPSWLEPLQSIIKDRGMAGGTLGYNSNVYICPLVTNGGNRMIELDPANQAFTAFDVGVLNVYPDIDVTQWTAFTGAVNGRDNRVYFIPRNRNVVVAVMYIDTTTRQLGAIRRSVVGGYFGGVLAPNGKIYCIPNDIQTQYVLTIIPGMSSGPDWPLGPVHNKF